MEKPDLNRMWQTFIKIGLPNEVFLERIIHIIRFKMHPMISDLRQKKIIGWYHFLIHNRESGVPTTKDDNNLYFHVRVALEKDVKPKDFRELLPSHCVMTDKTHPNLRDIDRTLLKNEDIEEAWRIIGEQSEWIMKMLDIYKENVEIPITQITQFMHYFLNMLGLGNLAILLLAPFIRF